MAKIKLKQNICPSCGGETEFNPDTQMCKCKICGNEFIINPYKALEELSQDNAKSKCPNCGAPLHFNPKLQIAECPACDSSFYIIKENTDEDKNIISAPYAIIPFTLNENDGKKEFIKWLGQGIYTPNNIYDKINITSFKGTYIPLYFYQGTYDVHYTCEIGYDEQEQYLAEVSKYDSDLKRTVKTTEVRTRTVTRWQPYSDDAFGEFSTFALASDFLDCIGPEKVMSLNRSEAKTEFAKIPFFCEEDETLNNSSEFDERYISGYSSVPFNLEYNEAYEMRAKSKIIDHISNTILQNAHGEHTSTIRQLNNMI